MSESITLMTAKMMIKQPDPQFVELADKITTLGATTSNIGENCADNVHTMLDISSSLVDLSKVLFSFCTSLLLTVFLCTSLTRYSMHVQALDTMAEMEPVIGPVIKTFIHTCADESKIARKAASEMADKPMGFMREYERYTEVLQGLLKRRDAVNFACEVLNEDLEAQRKQQKKDMQPEKKVAIDAKVASLEDQVTEVEQRLRETNQSLLYEVSEFGVQRETDVATAFKSLADSKIAYFEKALEGWSAVIDELTA